MYCGGGIVFSGGYGDGEYFRRRDDGGWGGDVEDGGICLIVNLGMGGGGGRDGSLDGIKECV